MAFHKVSITTRHNRPYIRLLPFPPSSLRTSQLIPTAPGNDRRRNSASRAVATSQPLNPKKPHSLTGRVIDTEGAIGAIQQL